MPIQTFHDKEADRVHVVRDSSTTHPEPTAAERHAFSLACKEISRYMDNLRAMKLFATLSVDAFVGNCLHLPACSSYLDWEDEQKEYARRKELLRFVSMKIKEYIDSKE